MLDDTVENKTSHIAPCIPIYVMESVLDNAAISLGDAISGEDIGDILSGQQNTMPLAKEITEEELEKMSAFSDFLQDLPGLEDLGEKKDSE